MPWKGLRIGVPDGPDSKRYSVLDRPQSASRHSEQLPRPSLSASNLVPRHSESIPRSPRLTDAEGDDNIDNGHTGDDGGGGNGANGNDGTKADNNGVVSNLGVPGVRTDSSRPTTPNAGNSPASPASPGEALSGSLRRSRFSFMKLRHASDPQLSKSYAKAEPKPPPVPAIPPRKFSFSSSFPFVSSLIPAHSFAIWGLGWDCHPSIPSYSSSPSLFSWLTLRPLFFAAFLSPQLLPLLLLPRQVMSWTSLSSGRACSKSYLPPRSPRWTNFQRLASPYPISTPRRLNMVLIQTTFHQHRGGVRRRQPGCPRLLYIAAVVTNPAIPTVLLQGQTTDSPNRRVQTRVKVSKALEAVDTEPRP